MRCWGIETNWAKPFPAGSLSYCRSVFDVQGLRKHPVNTVCEVLRRENLRSISRPFTIPLLMLTATVIEFLYTYGSRHRGVRANDIVTPLATGCSCILYLPWEASLSDVPQATTWYFSAPS